VRQVSKYRFELARSAPDGAERDTAAIQFHAHIPADRARCAKDRDFLHDCYNSRIMAEMPDTRATSLEESMRRTFAAIESLTEHEKKLDEALARLAVARLATERSFQETDRLLRQQDGSFAQIDSERSQRLDAQIAELLADIRKLKRSGQ
jgi:hypothetical protein